MKKIYLTLMMLLATLAAQAENYGINVGGVEVSSSNYNNVTGGYISSGTVTYNRSTNTLTLNNVSITNTNDGKYALHNRSCDGLTVVIQGTCYFNTKAHAIHFDKGGTITIASGGKLLANQSTTTSDETGAIYIKDDWLNFDGPGQLSVLSNRCGIIGTGASSSSGIRFDEGINAIIQGSRGDVVNLNFVTQYQGCNVIYKATNDYRYPNVRNVEGMYFKNKTEIVEPWYASFSEAKQSIVNGSNDVIYDTDIYVHSNYGVVIKYKTFPDYNFRQYLLSLVPKGYFTDGELQSLVSLDVSGKNIYDLTGIRLLRYVQILKCYNNRITSLDVYNMPLVYLDCHANQISSLDIGAIHNLAYLDCGGNSLSSLDVSDKSSLKTLMCAGNGLTSLNVTGTTLTTLDCHANNLMDIRGLPSSLQTLDCHSNSFSSFSYTHMRAMESLNISNCYSLTSLNCCDNNLTYLNVSSNTALTKLRCYANPSLTSITGLADCNALDEIYCYDCALTDLSCVNDMTNLEKLECGGNKLTSLTVTNMSKLTRLICSLNLDLTTATVTGNSKLSELNFVYCLQLNTLDCSQNNALTTLSVSECTAMTHLYCYDDHNLASISGLGDCTAMQRLSCFDCALTDLSAVNSMYNIEFLNCSSNQLTSLQVTNKSKLTTIACHYNPQLRTITATGNPLLNTLYCMDNPQLWKLDCYSNALPAVNVTGCSDLKELRCYDNPALASIEGLADCTGLQKLYCSNSALTSLSGINNMADLDYLNCHDTRLTALGLTNKNRLTTVLCYNNPDMATLTLTGCAQLTQIDTKNCPKLKTVNCYSNNLTTLNVTGNTALTTLNCQDNGNLASITGLGDCTAMDFINCNHCALTDLSAVNSMSQLSGLSCSYNKLTELTLTNKSNLTTLYFDDNPDLVEATITNNPQLSVLTCRNCPEMWNLDCSNNALTTLTVTGCSGLEFLSCNENHGLSSIPSLSGCSELRTLRINNCNFSSINVSALSQLWYFDCGSNRLTSLSVPNPSLLFLDCSDNQLTSLNMSGCPYLLSLACYKNRISGAGMTTLVNSLPMRDQEEPGSLGVLYDTGEGNTMTAAQIATARSKFWTPMQYNGSEWVEYGTVEPGDVDGDGQVTIGDGTAIIDLILSRAATVQDYPAADVDGDGLITIGDVTTLMDLILFGE